MIELRNNNGFKWEKKGKLFFKGYDAFISKNGSNINSKEELEIVLNKTNSVFSAIYEDDTTILAAVDRIRSIPLYYALHNNQFYLSDDANYIWSEIGGSLDENSKEELSTTGFVTANNTLHSKIKQICPGSYIIYNKVSKEIKNLSYFEFRPFEHSKLTKKEIFSEIERAHVNIFSKLISHAEGRTIVVPLSGGYDSRLIVELLKKLNYKNVICFTYGAKSNQEVKISQKIASNNGFEWHFVEYIAEEWSETIQSQEYAHYSIFAGNMTSTPVVQDFLAVKKLKDEKVVPENSIFVPGHAYDFIAGSHIPGKYLQKELFGVNEMRDDILKKLFVLKVISKQGLANRFKIDIENKSLTSEEAISFFDYWNWKERQAKFIANAVRVYEYFGYEWNLPFWEVDLLKIWSNLSVEDRYKRNLFIEFMKSSSDTAKVFDSTVVRIPFKQKIIGFLTKNLVGKYLKNIIDLFLGYRKSKYSLYGVIPKKMILYKAIFFGFRNINSHLGLMYLNMLEKGTKK